MKILRCGRVESALAPCSLPPSRVLSEYIHVAPLRQEGRWIIRRSTFLRNSRREYAWRDSRRGRSRDSCYFEDRSAFIAFYKFVNPRVSPRLALDFGRCREMRDHIRAPQDRQDRWNVTMVTKTVLAGRRASLIRDIKAARRFGTPTRGRKCSRWNNDARRIRHIDILQRDLLDFMPLRSLGQSHWMIGLAMLYRIQHALPLNRAGFVGKLCQIMSRHLRRD